MTIKTIGSEEARLNWSDTLDHARFGNVVIIERWNKPVVGLISHERLQKFLEMERLSEHKRQIADVLAGNGTDLDSIPQ